MTPRTTPIESSAAWRGQTLQPDSWALTLSQAQVDELDRALAAVQAGPLAGGASYQSLTKDDFPLPVMQPVVSEILASITEGRGFLTLRGLPVERWGESTTRIALWGLGTHLGWAEPQDGAGNLMHDVRDVGRKFGSDANIRYFQTNQAIEFHNDGADLFALCCLRKGRAGGFSRLVSAVEVFNEIARRRPDLVKVLQENFHVDARGQRNDGARCQVIPIFAIQDGYLSIILKIAYVHSAQRFEDVPRLSDAQREGLAILSEVMEEPGMALELELTPGDVLFGSNHVLLHGRTAFTDASASEPRHMLRLWLTVPNGPPLPAHYADTREFAATYARRVASSSSA